MAALLELILLIVGMLLGIWLFNFILVPLLYGLPRILYWTLRRYLKWRTPFLYALDLVFWIGVVLVVVLAMVLFFREFTAHLANSDGFSAGLVLGILLMFGKVLLFRSARADINHELLNYLKPYLTGMGRTVLTPLILLR